MCVRDGHPFWVLKIAWTERTWGQTGLGEGQHLPRENILLFISFTEHPTLHSKFGEIAEWWHSGKS
jgi:hypothetical protein